LAKNIMPDSAMERHYLWLRPKAALRYFNAVEPGPHHD